MGQSNEVDGASRPTITLSSPRPRHEIQFRDSGTDRAGYHGATFDCDELIDFPLVSAATCLWTTSDKLTVTLDYRATCIPGDNVTVLGSMLKPYCSYSDCSCWPLANASGPVLLEPPDVSLTPVAIFVGSQSIGSCSDVGIDLTTSIGSGGRDWAIVEWSMNSSLPDANLTAIRSFVAMWNLAAQPELVVPNTLVLDDNIARSLLDDAAGDDAGDDNGGATYLRLIQPNHYYEFSVKLENFLGFAASSPAFRVSVAAGAIPNLIITAGERYDMLVPSQLTIFAQASVALCPGEKARTSSLTYVWKCSREDAVSTSVDPRYFKVDPFSFNSSQSYALEVVVIDRLGLNNSATTTIVVGQSALVAAIEGGDRIVGISKPLVIDATPSLDPDDPDDSSGLIFVWSCEAGDLATQYAGGKCAGDLTGDSVQTITLDSSNLGTFKYTVVVSKVSRGVWRNVASSAVIEMTYDVVPPASIAALGIAKANPSEKLILVCSVGPAELPVDITWSLASGGLASGSLSLSASTSLTGFVEVCVEEVQYIYVTTHTFNHHDTFSQCPKLARSLSASNRRWCCAEAGDIDTFYLVLPAGTLTAGGFYQFQLTAQYASGTGSASATPGYSVLAVQMNAPPSSGMIAVTVNGGEPIGVVLQDSYDLACSGWVDDVSDLPLLYSFYYAIAGATTEYQLVSHTPSDRYNGALLPRGGGNASEIICIGYVADSYAASSRTTAIATVLPMVIAVSDLANLTAKLLADSFEAGNVEVSGPATGC